MCVCIYIMWSPATATKNMQVNSGEMNRALRCGETVPQNASCPSVERPKWANGRLRRPAAPTRSMSMWAFAPGEGSGWCHQCLGMPRFQKVLYLSYLRNIGRDWTLHSSSQSFKYHLRSLGEGPKSWSQKSTEWFLTHVIYSLQVISLNKTLGYLRILHCNIWLPECHSVDPIPIRWITLTNEMSTHKICHV